MRLLSSKTKLVVADEPSAAIDPIGEHELFERLREHRRGKTMIFISHRFGHLTKYADQILYVHLLLLRFWQRLDVLIPYLQMYEGRAVGRGRYSCSAHGPRRGIPSAV